MKTKDKLAIEYYGAMYKGNNTKYDKLKDRHKNFIDGLFLQLKNKN